MAEGNKLNLSSEVFCYPIVQELLFGSPSSHELVIEPDIDIRVTKILCNIPSAGMIKINHDRFYEYDPYGIDSIPLKDFKCSFVDISLVLRRIYNEKIKIVYSGFTPKGFINGQNFFLNYTFIGHVSRA